MHFFILSDVNNYCVSSSARACIVSNWCVRITECCRKDIKGHQSSGGSRGRVQGVRTPHQTRYLFDFFFLSNILLLVLNEAVLSYPAEVDKESDYEYPDM